MPYNSLTVPRGIGEGGHGAVVPVPGVVEGLDLGGATGAVGGLEEDVVARVRVEGGAR